MRNKKSKHVRIKCINFVGPILHGARVNTTRPGPAQICCIDVTTSCANSVNMMLFTRGNMIFPGILGKINVTVQDRLCEKSFILGSGPVYHLNDRREYEG